MKGAGAGGLASGSGDANESSEKSDVGGGENCVVPSTGAGTEFNAGLAGVGTIIEVRHSGHCACLPAAAAAIRSSFWQFGQRNSIGGSAGGAEGKEESGMKFGVREW